MKAFLKKVIDSWIFFAFILLLFISAIGVTVYSRDGKDLRVDLFGVEQILQGHSPYENPLDPNRTIFRYAPAFTILMYPFLLISRMSAPFQFNDILPSAFAWYLTGLFSLAASAVMLLKLIPSASRQMSIRNLKISLLMALPLIGYELSNGQNKLVALCFMLASIVLFEKNRLLACAVFFSLALTIYIALLPFLFYFVLRKKEFILSFLIAALIVFFVVPSFIFGITFNAFLLQEWFTHSLKPFFLTSSYASYIDLRVSSQALPSAIGRLCVSGRTGHFMYFISPLAVHLIIRVFSSLIVAASLLAAWKSSRGIARGLEYAIFLTLALLLPQYCIFYTWSYSFVLYFAVFNYISYGKVPGKQKKALLALTLILFCVTSLISIRLLSYYSFLFWATFALWLGMIVVSIRQAPGRPGAPAPSVAVH